MGIPVWVSRDLVLDLNAAVISLDNNQQKQAATTASGDFQPKASHKHVDSLLHDLNTQTQQTSRTAPTHKINNQGITATTPVAPIVKKHIEKQATEIARTDLHTVYACGDLNADWMVIGESPDISTNGQEQPYPGDSGILLSNMLKAIGIHDPRKNAYLVNILKTTIQEKTEADSAQLNSLLLERIQQVKPKILLVVGQIAAQNLLKTKEPLIRLRGKQQTLPNTQIPLVVTYYPSYLLSKPIDKRKAWEDLKLAMMTIQQSI